MRAVVQRVGRASVTVNGERVSHIGPGFLILLGVAQEDSIKDAQFLAEKIANLRAFEDKDGKMNISLLDVGGAALCVSQFTLYGDCRRGRRPSFSGAAKPEKAEALYESFVAYLEELGIPVSTGVFQAHMEVDLVNDGPVTLLLSSDGSL